MIRRSPAELYIKYLLLHSKNYDNDAIKEILQFAQLDYLGDWYLDRLRSKLTPPVPFRPFNKAHHPSQRFLLSSGLSWIFHPDKHGLKAFEILERPRVKEYVESSIASSAPSAAISYAVTRYLRFNCAPIDIDRYREFFWNVDLLDSTELRAALKLRIDLLEHHPNSEIRAQHGAMRQAYYKDARKTAAELPFSPIGAMLTQMRMGIVPSHTDVQKLMEQAKGLAANRSYEAMFINGPGDSKRALDYAGVLEKISNVSKEMTDPQEQMRDQLATIAMRTDDKGLPSVHTLSLGRHTAEVAKMETTNELPADFDDGEGGDESPGEPG